MSENPYSFNLVMLVDDNKICNVLNRRLFELTQFSSDLVEAINGLEALNYLKAHAEAPGRLPEIIFLDVYMPILDGIGFLREFNKLPHSILSKSRIIILSSTLDANDYRKVNESSYVIKFVEKPLNKKKIFETDLKKIREEYISIINGEVIAA